MHSDSCKCLSLKLVCVKAYTVVNSFYNRSLTFCAVSCMRQTLLEEQTLYRSALIVWKREKQRTGQVDAEARWSALQFSTVTTSIPHGFLITMDTVLWRARPLALVSVKDTHQMIDRTHAGQEKLNPTRCEAKESRYIDILHSENVWMSL